MNEPRVTGTNNMTIGVGRIAPCQGHTRHNHVGSEEFIFFSEGTAEQTIETETIWYPIPDSAYHSIMNIGDTDLAFLACYLHAGPEAGLRAEAIEIIPPKNAK